VIVALGEDDGDGVTMELDAVRAAALETSRLVQVLPVEPGRWRLLPRGRVGAVNLDGVDVVVTPKVGIARLLFLLGYAADPGFRPDDVEGVPDDDLWPAIAETLCRHAERALGRGVLQGYVTEEDALPLVRGVSGSPTRSRGGPGRCCRWRCATTSTRWTWRRTGSCVRRCGGCSPCRGYRRRCAPGSVTSTGGLTV
jgi:hypothetical protein